MSLGVCAHPPVYPCRGLSAICSYQRLCVYLFMDRWRAVCPKHNMGRCEFSVIRGEYKRTCLCGAVMSQHKYQVGKYCSMHLGGARHPAPSKAILAKSLSAEISSRLAPRHPALRFAPFARCRMGRDQEGGSCWLFMQQFVLSRQFFVISF